MLRAAVPKASIDEDRDLLSRERDISSAAQLFQRPIIHPIAKPLRVQ